MSMRAEMYAEWISTRVWISHLDIETSYVKASSARISPPLPPAVPLSSATVEVHGLSERFGWFEYPNVLFDCARTVFLVAPVKGEIRFLYDRVCVVLLSDSLCVCGGFATVLLSFVSLRCTVSADPTVI